MDSSIRRRGQLEICVLLTFSSSELHIYICTVLYPVIILYVTINQVINKAGHNYNHGSESPQKRMLESFMKTTFAILSNIS
jgi:hypothetical protein